LSVRAVLPHSSGGVVESDVGIEGGKSSGVDTRVKSRYRAVVDTERKSSGREVRRDDGVVEEEELSKKNLETFESTRCLESKLIL